MAHPGFDEIARFSLFFLLLTDIVDDSDGVRIDSRTPGSAAVLLPRHFLFPPPPIPLCDLTAIGNQGPVTRQFITTANGRKEALILEVPNLLSAIHDAFQSEEYADRVIETSSWEEQSISNLYATAGIEYGGQLLDAMEQINARMPNLRPGASATETEERWRDLFSNCDADFLISGISQEAKRELEKQLDEWGQMVAVIIAEEYGNPDGTLNITRIAASAKAGSQHDLRDCFGECVKTLVRVQRRVARRTIETCARMVIAGLPPTSIAVVPIEEIIGQFKRELRSYSRHLPYSDENSPLSEAHAEASGTDAPTEIAELLTAAPEMLANEKAAPVFWDQFDELLSAGIGDWERALDMLEATVTSPRHL